MAKRVSAAVQVVLSRYGVARAWSEWAMVMSTVLPTPKPASPSRNRPLNAM